MVQKQQKQANRESSEEMKNNEISSSYGQKTGEMGSVEAEGEVSRQAKINQLSADKMRSLIQESMLKKSTSLASLGPIMFGSGHSKVVAHHKSITESRGAYKREEHLLRKPTSPKKGSYGSPHKVPPENENLELEEKRRRVYGMPYFFENSEPIPEGLKYIAVPPSPPYLQTPVPYMKVYTETISTTSSSKEKSQLRISDFEMGRILGYGKFGHVYMARHKKSGFVCALKQIKREGLDEGLETQLVREIKVQMFLNHPNIVKLYTFFSDSCHIYLMLELCSSGQLYNFLKRHQPVQEELAKVIIRQICQGIDYIHENHIIHRDLKPENILYHNSMMKICDFGWSIATPLMRETFCGTPLYVSPQLLKRTCYNNKIDIWSLGILAYEILVGQVPFEIFCEADYIKILKNDVKFPRFMAISEEAKDFIRGCLEKDPEKRLTCTELLQHPFLKKVELINFPEIY